MNRYEQGMEILTNKFGNNKDNIIALATVARYPNADGKPRPVVRDVDAHYEDGVFYVVTYAKSSKMQQIAENNEIAISVNNEWFNANAVGENLGWVLDPKNAEIRTKLRTTFAAWYDFANNEKDENCCFLAIRLTQGIINLNHFETLYRMDFANKTATMEGKEPQ